MTASLALFGEVKNFNRNKKIELTRIFGEHGKNNP
jgi:hypothetical protein